MVRYFFCCYDKFIFIIIKNIIIKIKIIIKRVLRVLQILKVLQVESDFL